jgi:tetratricopeptide (TPR) repeat protein
VAPQPEPPAAAPRQLPTSPAAAAPTAPPADEPVAAGDVAPSPEAAAALSAASAKLSEITQQAAAKAKREAKRTDPKLLAKEAKKALSREQFAKARELFHESIQQGEATPENVTGLGWALLGMGNSEAAVAQFNKALFINDGFEDAYIGLGKAERQRGRLREARKVYERHLSRFPDSRKASISRYQIEQLRAQLGE